MNKYRIQLSKSTSGQLLITYRDGCLYSIIIEAKEPQMFVEGFEYLFNRIPFNEQLIPLAKLPMKLVNETPANIKVQMFCDAYRHNKKLDYKATKKDGGIIKSIDVTYELLKIYFEAEEWWNKVKSIKNYCQYINEIRSIAKNGSSKFPESYSKEYASKLKADKLQEYWKFLRSKGWKPKKNGHGEIIDWTL